MIASDVLSQAEQALVSMDAEVLVSLYSEEFLFEDTASGDRITDREELRRYFDRLFSMPKVNFSDVSFYRLEDKGAGNWTWGGTAIQSGEVYSIRGASLFKLEGDRIKEEIIFYDPRLALS